MDRLRQAEAALAALAARNPSVLVPGRVTSPMDSATTAPVPRAVIDRCWAAATAGLDPAPGAGPIVDEQMRRLAAGSARPREERDTA